VGDPVSAPAHYTRYPIQPRVFIMTNNMEFWRGNVIKYAARAGFKIYDGLSALKSEIRDLEKARDYIDERLKQLRSK